MYTDPSPINLQSADCPLSLLGAAWLSSQSHPEWSADKCVRRAHTDDRDQTTRRKRVGGHLVRVPRAIALAIDIAGPAIRSQSDDRVDQITSALGALATPLRAGMSVADAAADCGLSTATAYRLVAGVRARFAPES